MKKLGKTASEVLGLKNRKLKEGSRRFYPPVALNNRQENARHDFPNNAVRSTKYTAWNYVPKLLYEQFRKLTSWYFLLIVIISCIPSISPITPFTTLAGFIFIIGVSAVREIYEDLLRYRADKKVNERLCTVVDPPVGLIQRVRSEDIRVGELVLLEANDPIPADILVLATPLEGACYIETSQLDGETNLKLRSAPDATANLKKEDLIKLQGRVDCETPHHSLYSFKATLTLFNNDNSTSIPLSEKHLLLKGSVLRNTPYVVGVVVYAGPETKQALNQKDPPSKMSTLDKRMNLYVSGILIFQIALCVGMGVGAALFSKHTVAHSWYLDPESFPTTFAGIGITTFFTYFALMSYLIPISLVVSLEVIKVVQSKFMEWDEHMSNGKEHLTAQTSNLNDELGLVEYVLTDKTGTLTENLMRLSKCSINGVVYDCNSLGSSWEAAKGTRQGDLLTEFLLIMSLCHAVIPEVDKETDVIRYRASSPDEEALVNAAAENGFRFTSKVRGVATVSIIGTPYEFQVLDVMEFTSDRRRMSVIVRTPEGKIVLWSKGADYIMLQRLAAGDTELLNTTKQQLDAFSTVGLRTLVVARKEMSLEEYEAFHSEYVQACCSLDPNRDDIIEQVCNSVEHSLHLIGATAIEDKLQELVPETIEYLLAMGIKVWMITGDKQETAVNIGFSTRLLQPPEKMDLAFINVTSSTECHERLQTLLSQMRERDENPHAGEAKKFAIVIDGASLKFVISDHPNEFIQLSQRCHSVVCCRVTPIQKAKVVRLVKDYAKATCLAIGDGGNDVSMIQEAQVGVGIMGNEGTQAARASDFAIPRFRFLQRLLAVHGRYSLVRSAGVIHYSFYKNAAIFLVQVWWSIYSGYSGQSLFDDWIMTLFNMTITALPPVVYGVFEKDIGEKLINTHPAIYNRTQSKQVFTRKTLFLWLGLALYHSVVLFFGSLLVFQRETIWSNGQTCGLTLTGNIVMSVGLVVIFLQLAIETGYWTIITHFAYWGSLGFYFITLAIQSNMLHIFPDQYGMIGRMLSSPVFWLWTILCSGICLVPYIFHKSYQRMVWPEDWQRLQDAYRLAKKRGEAHRMISESAFGQLAEMQTYSSSSSSSGSINRKTKLFYSDVGDQDLQQPFLAEDNSSSSPLLLPRENSGTYELA